MKPLKAVREKRLTSYAIKIKALLLSPVGQYAVPQVFAALAVVWKNCAGQETIKLFPIKVGPVTLPHRYLFRSLQRYHTRASCCIMSPNRRASATMIMSSSTMLRPVIFSSRVAALLQLTPDEVTRASSNRGHGSPYACGPINGRRPFPISK